MADKKSTKAKTVNTKGSGGININIGGNVEGNNIISSNNNVVMQKIQDSFNKTEAADIQADLKEP